MALNKEQFVQNIIAIQDEMIRSEDYESGKRIYAEKLALAIESYLLTATIQITGTSNQGPFTGTGKIE
ncbi:hypothetical protein [Empedobacter tilapiae]|uniref:Uncharacterized protein n=1 Tax=Empedobacter tilapiae TaxID=2491114 RepID=A0A4Z1BSI8_9FLAO|nr:hypothetical protein [Empedobacter tilapiae]TGN26752.1 hypothetical protein E4J94_09915 [Empedobacter tilapiae]